LIECQLNVLRYDDEDGEIPPECKL
jgi:hypothetical protein